MHASASTPPSAEAIAAALASVPEGYAIVPCGPSFYSARILARDGETGAVLGYRDLSYDGVRIAIERDPAKLLPLIASHQRERERDSRAPTFLDDDESSRPTFGKVARALRRKRAPRK